MSNIFGHLGSLVGQPAYETQGLQEVRDSSHNPRQEGITRPLKSNSTISRDGGALPVTKAPHKDHLVEVLCLTQ